MSINDIKKSHKFYNKTDFESIQQAQPRLGLSDEQVMTYLTYYDTATSKIEELQTSEKVIVPPNYLVKNAKRLQSIDDFDKRIKEYAKVTKPNYIKNLNRETNNLFKQYINKITDDEEQRQYLIKKYNRMSISEKRKFFDDNDDLRNALLYEDDFTNEVFDLTSQKVNAYMDDIFSRRKKI